MVPEQYNGASAGSRHFIAYSSTHLERGTYTAYCADMANRGDKARVEALCGELAALIERMTFADGRQDTALPALTFWRFSNPTTPAHVIQQPAVYIVVQGRKQIIVADTTYRYDPSQYLAVSLELPAIGRVVKASPKEPYLCITLEVDPRELASLIVEAGLPPPRDVHDGRALYVSPLDSTLLDALLRLVRLLDAPEDIPVLAPLILRELQYRLLQGEAHGRLAEIAIGDSRLRRVAGAITWIKEHFTTIGSPVGHGFSTQNVASDTAYYTFDPVPGVHCVVLDTVNGSGGANGSIDQKQFDWLDGNLAANAGKLTLVFGHHSIGTMDNLKLRENNPGPPRSGADLEKSVKLFDLVNRQDFEACELCQSVTDSKKYKHGGVLVPSEHHIAEFQNWTADAVAD